MFNNMNAFELSDEQLAEVAGGTNGSIGSPVIQVSINNNIQTNTAIAPSLAIATSVGGSAAALLKGAQLKLNNGGVLGNLNGVK